jgi:hypothetical protein
MQAMLFHRNRGKLLRRKERESVHQRPAAGLQALTKLLQLKKKLMRHRTLGN